MSNEDRKVRNRKGEGRKKNPATPAATSQFSLPTSQFFPRLRFPEFLDLPGWKLEKLSTFVRALDAGVSVNAGDRPATPDEIGVLKTSCVTSGIFEVSENKVVLDSEEQERVTECVRGDTIIISRMNTLDLVGANAYIENDVASVFLPDRLWAAKPAADVNMRFIAYILGSNRGRAALSELAAGSSGSMKNISKSAVLELPVSAPEPAEQQKIAECLSSLDGLIATEGRKLEALKAHKKGLMQQLFPQPGQTQPRLRFPEFRNAGEWVFAKLSSCLKKVIDYRGKAPPKAESGIPLITAKNVRFGWLDMTNDEYIEEGKYEDWMSKGIPQSGDILFTTEAPLGNVALFPSAGKFALGQRIITLRTKAQRCLPKFLFHSLLGPTMQNEIDFHSTGSTAKGIKSAVFVNISFCYPGIKEQQRIAECLTTLDTRIAAQAAKIESLKQHKRGLMQQLFPSPEENEL